MEEIEAILPLGAPGLGIDPAQQLGIPLGVEDDDHIAAADILGDQQLGQAGLAHPGGTQHQHMAHPFTEFHPHLLLMGLHGMKLRFATYRR